MKEQIERIGAACDEFLGWCLDHLGGFVIMVILGTLALLFVLGLWAMIYDANSPHFQLKKSDWRCTQEHTEVSAPTYVKSGDVMVPVGGGSRQVCDQWSRVQ